MRVNCCWVHCGGGFIGRFMFWILEIEKMEWAKMWYTYCAKFGLKIVYKLLQLYNELVANPCYTRNVSGGVDQQMRAPFHVKVDCWSSLCRLSITPRINTGDCPSVLIADRLCVDHQSPQHQSLICPPPQINTGNHGSHIFRLTFPWLFQYFFHFPVFFSVLFNEFNKHKKLFNKCSSIKKSEEK